MAFLKCSYGAGGGDGADLIVTCSSSFAGQVITCTDGSSYTKTQTCPSSSPYEVIFESIPPGTYTISGVVSGQTFSTTKTILDFEAELNDIPDGSTVTPTDDIQIWLNCGNIWDKAYTTISQVLADSTTLSALIADSNAVDYMVRSTTWATDVCADQLAMNYIGLDDNCAITLLNNSTWCNAICNSAYFESVLNAKVPTMTSNTTPSGEAFASLNDGSAYQAFDNNTSTGWSTGSNQKKRERVGYKFPDNVIVKKAKVICRTDLSSNFYYQCSEDGNTWIDITDVEAHSASGNYWTTNIINNNNACQYYAIYYTQNASDRVGRIIELQFYGRASS